jgi:hypothetical protein
MSTSVFKALTHAGLVSVAATAMVAGTMASALADEPLQQGWWTVTNPGGLPGLPVQPPSDVPADGLLVQGGPTGPTAFAAVTYSFDPGAAVGQLTLTVARPSATTPASALQVCPLTESSFLGVQGGPMSEAPAYSCTNKATAQPDDSGDNYKFTVANLAVQGSLALAILPVDPTTRVVLSKPGTSSLEVTAPAASVPTGSDDVSTTEPPATQDTAPAPAPNTAALSAPSAPSLPAATAPTPEVAPSPTPTPTTSSGNFATASATSHKNSTPWTLGVLGGLLAAAALWGFAGRDKDSSPIEI